MSSFKRFRRRSIYSSKDISWQSQSTYDLHTRILSLIEALNIIFDLSWGHEVTKLWYNEAYFPVSSMPLYVADPESTVVWRYKIRQSVVFPEPVRPINPTTVPGSTEKLILSKTRFLCLLLQHPSFEYDFTILFMFNLPGFTSYLIRLRSSQYCLSMKNKNGIPT